MPKKTRFSDNKAPNMPNTPVAESTPDVYSEREAAITALQRVRNEVHSVTPANILALQRTIGNQAVRQLLRQPASPPQVAATLAPVQTAARVIQRAEAANPQAVAEEEWARVAGGQRIKYTALAAGCMAVTVFFQGGGAAGVHLAMLPTNANQLADFLAAIAGRGVSRVHLDCDCLNLAQGWRVKFDPVMGDPELAVLPRSTTDLQNRGGLSIQQQDAGGWLFDTASVVQWFEQKLGARPATSNNQNPEYLAPAAPAPAPAAAPAPPGGAAAAAAVNAAPPAAAAAAPAPAVAANKDEKKN